jgi:TAT (twin-arginine translocation) pathway signal sequence
MGSHNRRDFLQASAATAAAITLGPLTREVRAETTAPNVTAAPGAKEIEEKVLRARPVPLTDIRVTGGPAKLAQDADAKYLIELEPDRMMAY